MRKKGEEAEKTQTETGTFVDVLLSETLNRTFDRNLLHMVAAPAQLQLSRRRVFGKDVTQLQAVGVDV